MNRLLPLLFALAAPLPALAAGGASASPIVFNGLIVQDGQTKVSLYNPNTGDAKWIVVGKKFGSYTVERFQPAVPGQTADAVVLTLGASSQRITLQGSASNLAGNTTFATSVPATSSAISIAAAYDQRESLVSSLGKAYDDPNANPQHIQALKEAIQQQRSVMTASVAAVQVDSLNRSLAEARNDPNANPQLVQAFEETIQQKLAGSAQPDLRGRRDNGSDTNVYGGSQSFVGDPDGINTVIIFDANGRVTFVEKASARDANGKLTSNILYSAPSPAAPATPPAAAK